MQGGAQASLGSRTGVAGEVAVTALTETDMDAEAFASSAGVASTDGTLEFKLDLVLDQAFAALRPALQVNPIADVDDAANTLNVPGHGLATGDTVVYSNGNDDENIGALLDGSIYFVRVVDANTIRLYLSRADAENDVNAIDLAPTVGRRQSALAAGGRARRGARPDRGRTARHRRRRGRRGRGDRGQLRLQHRVRRHH